MGEIEVKGEPNKERLLAVLNGEMPDRVPYFDVLIESKHVEKMLKKFCGDTLGSEGEAAKGDLHTVPMDPYDYINVCKYTGQDVILCEAMRIPFRKEVNENLVLIQDKSITSRDKLKELVPPFEEDVIKRINYIKTYKKAINGTKIGVTVKTGALLSSIYNYITGFENFMINIVEDISFIEELLDIGAEYYHKIVKSAVEIGIDYLDTGNDLAYNSGLMFSPSFLNEIWREKYEMIIEPAISKGIPVTFESDGKIDEIIPTLIDMGFSLIRPMDSGAVDYREYKKKYGGLISLGGGIDIRVLANGDSDQIKNMVKDAMDVLKPGGRYVFGSSHSITNNIPWENYKTMMNTFYEFCEY